MAVESGSKQRAERAERERERERNGEKESTLYSVLARLARDVKEGSPPGREVG